MRDVRLPAFVLAILLATCVQAQDRFQVQLHGQTSSFPPSQVIFTTEAADAYSFSYSDAAGTYSGKLTVIVKQPLPMGTYNASTKEIVFDTPIEITRTLDVDMTLKKSSDPDKLYGSSFRSESTPLFGDSTKPCMEPYKQEIVTRDPEKLYRLSHTATCKLEKLPAIAFGPDAFQMGVSTTIDLLTFGPFGILGPHTGSTAEFRALPPVLKVDLIDPECRSEIDVRCQSGRGSFSSENDRTQYIGRLIGSPVLRKGVVADGDAGLVLRARAPADQVTADTKVTFALKKNGSPVGRAWGWLTPDLRAFDTPTDSPATVAFTALSADGKTRYAFASYRAPPDHPQPDVRNAENEIETEVTLAASTSANPGQVVETPIKIVPPPVVLVHGVWSNGDAWKGLKDHLAAAGFQVCRDCLPDYGRSAPAGSFDPDDPESRLVLGTVEQAVKAGLRVARQRGYAVKKVDGVGHSMGGIVLRARYDGLYRYGTDDLHKIITVGSPHRGSPLVDWLLRHKCDPFGWGAWLWQNSPYFGSGLSGTLENEFARQGKPLGPALYGFQTGSVALSHIGKLGRRPPSHAIIGVAPPTSETQTGLDKIPYALNITNAQGQRLTIDQIFGAGVEHDTIVPTESQAGGNPRNTVIESLVHADLGKLGVDVSETESELDVWARIVELLKAPIDGPFGSFEHYDGPGMGAPIIYNTSCKGKTLSAPPARAASGATVTLTPAAGTRVKAGETITLGLDVAGGTAVSGVYFNAGTSAWWVDGAGPSFSDTWTVPRNRAGRFDLAARTFGDGENYGAESYVIVDPPQPPVSIRLTPSEVYLDNTARLAGFTVLGKLPDGSEIDLSSSSAGTTYAIAAGGEAVIAMRDEGVIESVGEGTTSVTATYKGLTATAPVTVELTYAYQGLWWNAPAGSESGWGINFAHQGEVIFATWFTYDAEGKPTWLIALLNRGDGETYSGPVSRVTGPPFNAQPFDPAQVAETEVGTMTVSFADVDHATLAYTVNGISRSKSIVRQEFATPRPRCTWGGAPDLAQATNYQDLWWNAPGGSESGWGINFTHQGDIIFATWFTYGADGKPLWFIALLNKTADKVYAGEVSTVTGPPFQAEPFDASKVVETVVGNATVTFADGNAASFAYTVNGISQTKSIIRQVFEPPGTACH